MQSITCSIRPSGTFCLTCSQCKSSSSRRVSCMNIASLHVLPHPPLLASESRVPRTGVYMLCPSWRQKDAQGDAQKSCTTGRQLLKNNRKTTKGDKQMTKSVIIYPLLIAQLFISLMHGVPIDFSQQPYSSSTRSNDPPAHHQTQPLQPHLVEATWRTMHPPAFGTARYIRKSLVSNWKFAKAAKKCCLVNRTLKIF